MTSELERASALVDELETKRAQHVARAEKLAAERDEIALGAFTGNGKQRERVDEIHTMLVKHSSELAALDSALKSAHQRVADRRAAEARKADRQKAEALRKHVDELAAVPAFIDEHLEAALSGLLAYDRGIAELHTKFSVAFPTDIQTRLGMVAVIATFLQKLPPTWFNEIAGGVRYLSPAQRKTANSYFAQIEAGLRTAIKQRTGDAEQDPESRRQPNKERAA
jgi:hypothetical protein